MTENNKTVDRITYIVTALVSVVLIIILTAIITEGMVTKELLELCADSVTVNNTCVLSITPTR